MNRLLSSKWTRNYPDKSLWFWTGFLSGYFYFVVLGAAFGDLICLICESNADLTSTEWLQLLVAPLPFATLSGFFCMSAGYIFKKVQPSSSYKWLWSSFLCAIFGPIIASNAADIFTSSHVRWTDFTSLLSVETPFSFGICFWFVTLAVVISYRIAETRIAADWCWPIEIAG
jgi:hypothetical protein